MIQEILSSQDVNLGAFNNQTTDIEKLTSHRNINQNEVSKKISREEQGRSYGWLDIICKMFPQPS